MHHGTSVETPLAETPTQSCDDSMVPFYIGAALVVTIIIVIAINAFLPEEEDLADKLRKGIFR